ncbi:MAG TPA: hypothetical protein VK754_05255 [Propionibacteriaceae bacterium]|nr:hypothetical protein [Propionibacteriaceae bacterium]
MPEYRRMRLFREMYSVPACLLGLGFGLVDAAGTFAEAGAELAGGVAPRRAVASGLGTPVGVLSAGLHAKTVQERVPSRKVLRLTSNPIPRLLVLDRPGSSQCFRKWQVNCHVHATVVGRKARLEAALRLNLEMVHSSVVREESKQLRASEIARRRPEEDGAEALFPLRGTTTAAGSKRDARAALEREAPSCRWPIEAARHRGALAEIGPH